MLVLVLVAVLIVAGLGAVAYVLLSGGNPPPPPSAVKLDHVTVSGGASVDQAALLTLTAVAIDTKGRSQTANATWVWSAAPASAVSFGASGTPSTAQILAKVAGPVTITANATWNNSAKESTHSVTINALAYELTPSDTFPLVGELFTVSIRVLRGTTVATGYVGSVFFSSNDLGAQLNTSGRFTTTNAGQNTFTNFSLSRTGAATITASDTVAAITGTTTVNGNQAPVASFTITGNTTNPLQMQADGRGSSDPDGDPLTYAWDFGDLGTATASVVTHTYAAAGTYTVRLTVTDSHASSNSTQQTYHAKAPPTASFRVVSQTPAGLAVRVTVDASASADSDGTITFYNWDWGDGNTSNSVTAVTSHDYGVFWVGKNVTITLQVVDNDNLTASTSQTIQVTVVPLPPNAAFDNPSIDQGNRTVYVDASPSTDPNGNIAYYNWSWGDGSWTNLTVTTASHAYAADGNYVINLTVIDTTNLKDSFERTVNILQPPLAPTAVFTATRNLMHVDVDASASSDLNGNIATYEFDWGDGTAHTGPQAGATAGHDYTTPGKYTITVYVKDSTNLESSAAHTVSVAQTTLDYSFHDFFNVPYGEWWDKRYVQYGDLPINAECFNATSIADGWCTPATTVKDVETYPYANWYPLPGNIRPGTPSNNPLVYAPYRFDVKGVNVPGYNLTEPVFLPVLNYGAARGNRLDFRWYMQYFDFETGNASTAAGCPSVDPKFNDGFEIRSQVYLTLDLQESKRIFGVVGTTPAQAQAWWNANTDNTCAIEGTLESNIDTWYGALGGTPTVPGKYDIENSFEYAYTPFYTNITATVDPTTGLTRVYFEHAAWGTDVLLARMFYWGNASYFDPGPDKRPYTADDVNNYLDSTKARGWWGMELAWFEDFNFQGSLDTVGFNFTLSSAMQYHFQQLADSNAGGYDRLDDTPTWNWGPILSDYTNDYAPKHLASELDRYPSPYYGYVHSTPGSARYGQNLSYDYAPIKWDLVAGQTWHFQFPTGNVVFYDPNNTPLGSDPTTGSFVEIHKKLDYEVTKPAAFGVWNGANMTWDVYGPALTGGPVGNAGADGIPGNADDRYALEPWGALTLKTGAVAAFVIPSSVGMSNALPASSAGSLQLASRPGATSAATTVAIPVRTASRSRLE